MSIVNTNTSTNTLSNPTLDNALNTNLTNASGIASTHTAPTADMYGQVAGFTGDQTNAQNAITGMGQQQGFNTAQGALGNVAQGIGSLTGNSWTNPGTAQSFMNPYQQGVTDVANTEAARNSAITQNTNNAQAAQAGAFGGSRAGVVQGENQRNLALVQNNNQIQGANTAYNSGMSQFNTQQQNQLANQQALGQNAMNQSGVATAAQTANLGLDQAQLGVGNQQQALNQNVMNTNQSNADMAFNQPMQTAGWMQSIIQGSPVAMNNTTNSYAPPPNLGAQLTGLGIAGLGAYGAATANNNSSYSDSRLKKLIKLVGETVLGLGLYEWTYIADRTAKRYRGVMANEVRAVMPEAIVVDYRGFDTVNYGMLGINMEAA